MTSHRARRSPTRPRGRLVVLRGGLDLVGAASAGAASTGRASRHEEQDWASFAERVGFSEQSALPEDYEDRLAERIFGRQVHTSDADWTGIDALEPASGVRPLQRGHARDRVVMGILLAAAAVLIAWTSVGSPSRVALPQAPTRDASSPAVHAVDATSAPEEDAPAIEECPLEAMPDVEQAPKDAPDPGAQVALHRTPRAASRVEVGVSATASLVGSEARTRQPSSLGEEVVAEIVALASSLEPMDPALATAAPAPLVASTHQLDPDVFEPRVSTKFDWAARTPKGRPWGLAPTGERWLGVSAQPSDINAPRTVAVTAQLDVTRAFASF